MAVGAAVGGTVGGAGVGCGVGGVGVGCGVGGTGVGAGVFRIYFTKHRFLFFFLDSLPRPVIGFAYKVHIFVPLW